VWYMCLAKAIAVSKSVEHLVMGRFEVDLWLTYGLLDNKANATCTGIVGEYLCTIGKGSKNLPR
jgi:hypothetical protein